MNATTGRAGVIRARDDAGSMDQLAHAVLDDVLYNVISDLLMKTHREEKTARATTAAIRVEKLAFDVSDSSTSDSRPDVRVETDAAIYEDGKVLLKGNPLKTTQDILCPRCHLPRLLYPTDGKGAKKPDPTVTYCKKHPYIDKPGCDIYGQSWIGPGPGRGKKKKDADKRDGSAAPGIGNGGSNGVGGGGGGGGNSASGPGLGSSIGPDGANSGPEQRPPNVLSFPSATCSKCKRCILVTRLNNHMGSCIGNSGRNASRAAAQKINGGSGAGSQHDPNSPPSSKATPVPTSRAASPRKRDAASDDDDIDSETSVHRRKKMKPAGGAAAAAAAAGAASSSITKKVIIKTKPSLKKEKLKGSSLSQETKADYDSPGLASENKHNSNSSTHNNSASQNSPLLGNSTSKAMQKKTKSAMAAAAAAAATAASSTNTAADSPLKKLKLSKSAMNSPRPKISRDADGESESSGTLSSPPAHH